MNLKNNTFLEMSFNVFIYDESKLTGVLSSPIDSKLSTNKLKIKKDAENLFKHQYAGKRIKITWTEKYII